MLGSKSFDFYYKPRRTRDTISEEQVTKNLLELMERTNYPMVQENGQRTFGPCPDWDHDLPRPSTSCEVYVSQIPNNCFEDVLVPLFASVGKIYTLRLMLDFKVGHRGFAFVKFTKPEDAAEAIRRLDKFKLPSSTRPMRVMASRNSCEVEVSNLPPSVPSRCPQVLENLVHSRTEGVVSMRWTHANTRLVVQYTSHRDAAIARRCLIDAMPELGYDEARVQLPPRSMHQGVGSQKQLQTRAAPLAPYGDPAIQHQYTQQQQHQGSVEVPQYAVQPAAYNPQEQHQSYAQEQHQSYAQEQYHNYTQDQYLQQWMLMMPPSPVPTLMLPQMPPMFNQQQLAAYYSM